MTGRRVLITGAFAATLVGVYLLEATGGPGWYTSERALVLYLTFAMVAIVVDTSAAYRREGAERDGGTRLAANDRGRGGSHADVSLSGPTLAGVKLACTGLLVWIVLGLQWGGMTAPWRGIKVALVLLLLVVFAVVVRADRAPIRDAWPYVLAFAVLLAAHFWHVPPLPAGSDLGTFALRAGIWLVVSLFVVPRYVSTDGFLWVIAAVSALVVAFGAPAALVGPYAVFGLEAGVRSSSFALPFAGTPVPVVESFFPNPNTLGIATFAGTIAGLVAFVRSRDGGALVRLTAGALFVASAIGLVLSGSRASFLAAAVAAGVYLSYLAAGREALPYAVGSVAVGVSGFLGAVAVGVVPIDPGGRFTLWRAGVEALVSDPRLLGWGIVDGGEVIAPYISEETFRGHSPHNSYLTVFVRSGIVGGLAYLVLTVGSVVDGVLRRSRVDPAVLSLAVGFAVHQLFESYTLYHHTVGAVLSALSVGFLVASGARPGPNARERRLDATRAVYEDLL